MLIMNWKRVRAVAFGIVVSASILTPTFARSATQAQPATKTKEQPKSQAECLRARGDKNRYLVSIRLFGLYDRKLVGLAVEMVY